MAENILIVHGWMHSAARYGRLKRDLENQRACHVELYEFSGFGDTPVKYKRNILDNYVKAMKTYISCHEFDVIIAHSMGGNIVLKAVTQENLKCKKLVLLSPVYKGIEFLKPFLFLYPLGIGGINFLKCPCWSSDFLIKIMSLLTINHWRDIDKQILLDVRKVDSRVAARSLFELAFDSWKVKDNAFCCKVNLLLGEKDRVISKKKMRNLQQDLGGCKVQVFPNIGHTAVTEDYERFFDTIAKIIWED